MSLTVYENGEKNNSKEFSDKPPVQNLEELRLKYPHGGYAGMHVLVYEERCYYAWYPEEIAWLPLNGTISKEDLHACQEAIITLQELEQANASMSLEMTTKEATREFSENVRLENENTRIRQETNREDNEFTRTENESSRNGNEDNRINQENQRVTKENARLNEDYARAEQITIANNIIASTVEASNKADAATEGVNTIVNEARNVIDATNLAKTEANNSALAANTAKDATILATENANTAIANSILEKDATIVVRDATTIVKNDTLQVKLDTIIVKDATILAATNANTKADLANTAATNATAATDSMLSNLISLEIKDDLILYFKTPDTYEGLTFSLENGNLVATI